MSFTCTPEMFAKDVEKHSMEILHAEGTRRHLRFRRQGTGIYGFDIVTWTGSLCITGDCGTYVFSRLPDMFDFFRASANYPGHINPGYWAEKVDAQDKTGGIREFCPDTFKRSVIERFRDYWRDRGRFDDQLEAFRELRERVLDADNEHDAYTSLYGFDSNGMEFTDCSEMRFQRYTGRFIWNCRAIVWAIAQWDASVTSRDATLPSHDHNAQGGTSD